MTFLRLAAAAALLATPLAFSPALAQDKMMDDDDAMMSDDMMHQDMNVTCDVTDMGEMGMTITFHNMGGSDIPAGTKAHWKVRGVAQGDVNFMDAVGAGGMKEQMYKSDQMMHGSAAAPCSVDMM